MKRAVFMDRDGVINEICYHHDIGVYSARDMSEFRLKGGVKEAIKRIKAMGFLVIVVSNQPGVAFGSIREEDLKRIDAHLRGLGIDAVYNCTHHPHHTGECGCRKPKEGMVLQAAEEHDVELAESYMIGDNLTDIQAGKRCKKTILIGPDRAEIYSLMERMDAHPDRFVRDISEAVKFIEEDR